MLVLTVPSRRCPAHPRMPATRVVFTASSSRDACWFCAAASWVTVEVRTPFNEPSHAGSVRRSVVVLPGALASAANTEARRRRCIAAMRAELVHQRGPDGEQQVREDAPTWAAPEEDEPPAPRSPSKSGASAVRETAAAVLSGAHVSAAELLQLVTGAPTPRCVTASRPAALRKLLNATSSELTDAGWTELQAARLRALRDLGIIAATAALDRGTSLRASADVYRAFAPRFADLLVEQFHVVMLDGKHRVLRSEMISQGTLTSSPVHPREVFASAIRHSAAAVLLVHNHPSGDPTPSADDLEITRRLAQVGDLVGIRVVDHVVIGDGCYASLADRGLLGT